MDLSWYENNIEPEVREAVFILRNAGFNTLGSCGHGRWITIAQEFDDDPETIARFLYDKGYGNFEVRETMYCIEVWL